MRRFRLLLLLAFSLSLGLAACSVQTQPPPTTPEPNPPADPALQGSFTLSTDSAGNSLDPGGEVKGVPIRVNRASTFEGAVTFELFGAPEGVAGRFDPPSTTGDRSELTLQVSETTPSGEYDLTVRGKSGGTSNTVQIPLFVTEAASNSQPGFSVALSPSSLNLSPGESENVRVTFNRSGGVDGAIGLSVSGEPAGVTVLIDTSSQPTLRVTADERAVPGNYALTVRGASGGLSSSTQLGLSIAGEGGSDASGSARVRGSVRTANADISVQAASQAAASERTSLGMLSAAEGRAAAKPAFVPGQVLVQYRTGELSAQSAQKAAQRAMQMKVAVRQRFGLDLLEAGADQQPDLVTIPRDKEVEDVAAELRRDPDVLHAEPNYYLYPAALPNDPSVGKQWALSAAGLPVAWQRETGDEVVIAVLDSGFDLSHEDLASRFVPGYDFCALTSGDCANAPSDPDPSYGDAANSHGTLVAGVAGAAGDNGRGVAGVAYGGVKLLPVKLFNDVGTGATSQSFIQGIRWAVGLEVGGVPVNRNPARVVNISLGGDFSSSIVQSAIDEARGRGAVVVAATGNSGRGGSSGGVLSPAAANGVIGVGSINRDFERSCFSNYGVGERNGPGGVDLVAPGGEAAAASCNRGSYGLLSTAPGSRYETAIGTSFATPMVAGAAALILSREPGLSAIQVEERLLSGAYLDDAMSRDEYGRGVLRAERSLGMAGPGDQVSVTASGEGVSDSDLATVTLDLYGGSSAYSLEDLAAGRYRLEAAADGLSAQTTLSLRDGERRSGVTLELR